MKIHRWQGAGFRVTSSEDVFFKSPLSESTLFRFSAPYFEIEPHPGEFSIKTVLRGEERYFFARRVVTLRPGRLLLVNAGEEYASCVGSPTESLSIFFRRSDVLDAARYYVDSAENLLASPDGIAAMPEVAQVAFPVSPAIGERLRGTVAAVDEEDVAAVEESSRRLLLAALAAAWNIAPGHALSHVRRRSTRDELVSRVLRAREFIDGCGGLGVSLDRLADEACLSRFHFLRVFSEVVGDTPLAYARRVRLEDASRALRRGDDPRDVARKAGYGDVRAFLRAYRRTVGSTPDAPPGASRTRR